ncbi:MAG: methyltransferase [Spirochaetaceae bacterium]
MSDVTWAAWSLSDIEARIHRRSTFRFGGTEYQFALSQDLFSSHEVDAGSRLLLSDLKAHLRSPLASVYDIGCGTGVLGIVASREYETRRLVMEDRSALAVRFAEYNAGLNGRADVACSYCRAVGLDGPPHEVFDLVLSNVPAKAGEPVRRLLLEHAGLSCAEEGVCGFVLVNPLAQETEDMLHDLGFSRVQRITHAGHTVFLTGPIQESMSGRSHIAEAAYCRGAPVEHRIEKVAVRAQGFWGLGEFETISFQTIMLIRLIETLDPESPLVFWNPGTGVAPAWARKQYPGRMCTVASDDALHLAATATTLTQNRSRRTRTPVSSVLTPSVLSLRSFAPERAVLVLSLESTISPGQRQEIDTLCLALAGSGTLLVVAGNSAEVSRLERQPWSSVVKRSRNRGLRGLVLRIR